MPKVFGTRLLIAVVLAALPACVSVEYARPGQSIDRRPDETLVFGRIRFFHDEREYFPWHPVGGLGIERHVWLLRLEPRGVSAELHPDDDGSLAVWLESGDYALVGSAHKVPADDPGREVLALLRVPAGSVAAYTGELMIAAESREGGQLHLTEFGAVTVDVEPIESAQAVLEHRLGALPAPPVSSPWCAGDVLPAFEDAELVSRARHLLDRGCTASR